MPAPPPDRQIFPRWSVLAVPPRRACRPQTRTATLVALPTGRARDRRVLTYPAAILVPDRLAEEPATPTEPSVSPLPLLALLAPSVLLGLGLVLVQLLA